MACSKSEPHNLPRISFKLTMDKAAMGDSSVQAEAASRVRGQGPVPLCGFIGELITPKLQVLPLAVNSGS